MRSLSAYASRSAWSINDNIATCLNKFTASNSAMTVISEQCHRTLVWNMHWSNTAATRRPTLSRTTARSATAPLTWSKRSRHRDVSRLLCQYGLSFESFPFDDPHGCLKEYGYSMGIFICTNSSCSSSRWTSKQIAISIRRYPGLRYNARVCYQRCESCDSLTIHRSRIR